MQGETTYTIGGLAATAGVTVKAVRFYTDHGILHASHRTASGHRRYGTDAVARLALVRTLRDLGIDLATVRRIVDRETTPAEAAAAHAGAVAVQMRVLRLRHAVLTTAARRDSTPEELELMHRFARLSTAERDDLVAGFLDDAFGAPDGPLPRHLRRSLTPELPDDPTSEQLAAWVELAELTQDEAFRSFMRSLYDDHKAEEPTAPPRKHTVAVVAETVRPLLASDVLPGSPQAAAVVSHVASVYAASRNVPDSPSLRTRLAAHIAAANDPRRERYMTLLAIVNGWSPPDHPRAELIWFLEALRTP